MKGHDLEMGTNCLGPFLLNHFLEPILRHTAANAPQDSVRVIWVSSMVAVATIQDGIRLNDTTGSPVVLDNAMENYMQSKVGNVFLASETSKQLGQEGIISLVGCFRGYKRRILTVRRVYIRDSCRLN